MSHDLTHEQQRFTTSEVTGVNRWINGQQDPRCIMHTYHCPSHLHYRFPPHSRHYSKLLYSCYCCWTDQADDEDAHCSQTDYYTTDEFSQTSWWVELLVAQWPTRHTQITPHIHWYTYMHCTMCRIISYRTVSGLGLRGNTVCISWRM